MLREFSKKEQEKLKGTNCFCKRRAGTIHGQNSTSVGFWRMGKILSKNKGKGGGWILGQTGKWPGQEATLSEDPYIERREPCKDLEEENSSKRYTECAGQGWVYWPPHHNPGLSLALVMWLTLLMICFCHIVPFHSSVPLWCLPAKWSASLQRARGTWWRWGLLGRQVTLQCLSQVRDS